MRIGVQIDPEDEWILLAYNWRMIRQYVGTTVKGKTLYLHRLVLKAEPGQFVDHINNDKLDNRKSNLRFCTHSQNCRNRIGFKKDRPYKGLSYDKQKDWYKVVIYVNGKRKYIGGSKDPKKAAEMYDRAAIQYYGEFAKTNNLISKDEVA